MKKEKIEEIINKIQDEEQKKRLLILYNGYVAAQKKYIASATERKRLDMESAETALNSMIDSLSGGRAADKLDNIIDAVDYLHAQGWKIKKSTAYNHRDKGWLRPESDGKFLKSALDKYAAMKLKRLDARLDDKTEKMSADKQAAEIRKLLAQAKREEIKLAYEQGDFVPKSSFERELSYRAMVFKMDGDSFCRSEAGAIIELVGGDKDKIPDLQEFMLERFHKWLARYAADREFTVPAPAAEDILQEPDDEENSERVDGE